MDSADLFAFLNGHRLAVLSSIAGDGSPQSALIGVAVTRELDLVFDTLKTSRKYRNLTQRPQCSLVIGWSGEQTVQFEGIAEQPTGTHLSLLQAAYFEVWPECRAHLRWGEIAYFVVRPQWLRFSDYAADPLFLQEFTFGKTA